MVLSNDNTDDANPCGIVAALYYLSKEAERTDLPQMSAAIRQAIVTIAESRAADADTSQGPITTSQTCAVLDFFDHYLKASPAVRANFRSLLDRDILSA